MPSACRTSTGTAGSFWPSDFWFPSSWPMRRWPGFWLGSAGAGLPRSRSIESLWAVQFWLGHWDTCEELYSSWREGRNGNADMRHIPRNLLGTENTSRSISPCSIPTRVASWSPEADLDSNGTLARGKEQAEAARTIKAWQARRLGYE